MSGSDNASWRQTGGQTLVLKAAKDAWACAFTGLREERFAPRGVTGVLPNPKRSSTRRDRSYLKCASGLGEVYRAESLIAPKVPTWQVRKSHEEYGMVNTDYWYLFAHVTQHDCLHLEDATCLIMPPLLRWQHLRQCCASGRCGALHGGEVV